MPSIAPSSELTMSRPGVRPDQYDDKTPCDEWSVRDRLEHMIGVVDGLAAAAAVRAPEPFTLSADPASQFHEAATSAMVGGRTPGVLDRIATAFDRLGVDVARDEPRYDIPPAVGGRFTPTPVFEVELRLHPLEPWARADSMDASARRQARLAASLRRPARTAWMVRPVPTRIDAYNSTVEV
jgi:hypothetical protein